MRVDMSAQREVGDAEFHSRGAEAFRRGGCAVEDYSASYLKTALDTCKGKVKKFSELPSYAGFYFHDDVKLDAAGLAKDVEEVNQ